MSTIAEIVEQLHRQHKELLTELRKLQTAIEILDPPKELTPRPADEQIKELILDAIKRSDTPKTQHQLAKIIGIPQTRARKVADAMVDGGALDRRMHGKVAHYSIKREYLRIVAGEGVR